MSTLIEELEQAADWIELDGGENFAAAIRARTARIRDFEATLTTDSRHLRNEVFARLAGPLDPREEPGT